MLLKPSDEGTQFLDLSEVESGVLFRSILDRGQHDSGMSRWSDGCKIRGTINSGFSKAGLEEGDDSVSWIKAWLLQERTNDTFPGTFVTASGDCDESAAFIRASN